MNGYDYFQKQFTKRSYRYLFYFIVALGLILPLAGSIWSFSKGQGAAGLAFTIFFLIVLVFFCLPCFIIIYLLPRKSRIEKRKVAESLGLEATRADWGLTLERDFKMEAEEKIKYFPAVWFIPSLRKVPMIIPGYRASLMVTRKRLIIPGPKGLSVNFQKNHSSSPLFDSIEKIKYPSSPITFVDGLRIWYHIPNEMSDKMRLLPTEGVLKRQKSGYTLDHFWIFPQDTDDFIDTLENVVKTNQN